MLNERNWLLDAPYWTKSRQPTDTFDISVFSIRGTSILMQTLFAFRGLDILRWRCKSEKHLLDLWRVQYNRKQKGISHNYILKLTWIIQVCYFHLIEVMLHSRVHPCSESANRNINLLLLIIALNMENRKQI